LITWTAKAYYVATDEKQGDQIRRIFVIFAIGYLGSFLNEINSPHFGETFNRGKSYLCINLGKNTAWATFWAIFSLSHLVTLPGSHLSR
jgi:hypothetical protein